MEGLWLLQRLLDACIDDTRFAHTWADTCKQFLQQQCQLSKGPGCFKTSGRGAMLMWYVSQSTNKYQHYPLWRTEIFTLAWSFIGFFPIVQLKCSPPRLANRKLKQYRICCPYMLLLAARGWCCYFLCRKDNTFPSSHHQLTGKPFPNHREKAWSVDLDLDTLHLPLSLGISYQARRKSRQRWSLYSQVFKLMTQRFGPDNSNSRLAQESLLF